MLFHMSTKPTARAMRARGAAAIKGPAHPPSYQV